MKRFKFLAHKMPQNMDSGTGSSSSSDGIQVSKYMLEVEDHQLAISDVSDTMNFWNNRVNIYDKLSFIAQDILAVPASQAYIERGFSVCGLLTAGRRNRMTKPLQMRACLKLNKKALANTGINASV